MNTEDYKKIEELFNKMSESDKNRLKEFLLNHKEEFQADPVETGRKGLEEMLHQKEPYLNKIRNGNSSDNIISEKDPHTKLLEDLKSKFASMSYTDLYEFVKEFYFIQDDDNYQKFPVMRQQIAWNNEMHTQNLSNYFDFNYYLKNGITPEEFISTSFETYKKYDEINRQGKTM